jgi:uncharacterized protein
MSSDREPNRLAREGSPYLRQHALNPVDWYPWGPEALERARAEDRPIFLSIGYSACHWCHVMEAESFENPEIAGLMNDLFVNIKVDREERPDLDRIYMTAVQLISGSGGWPMSVFLTPELKPFHGGTYYPPEDRWGMPGFPRLLSAVATAYRTRREDIEMGAAEITERIRGYGAPTQRDVLLGPGLIDAAAERLVSSHDPVHGGFGGAPKFPQGLAVRLLLRQYRRTGDIGLLGIARTTLDSMAAGGIYDHVGGGFHRYSTDELWLVPHFEKMLYDQALLAMAYLEAFQITDYAAYGCVARGTLEYVLREMAGPEGGFYASEDADDPVGEGAFYTWTPTELRAALGDGDAELFSRAYDVDEIGNFAGRSILRRLKSDSDLASILKIPGDEIAPRLDRARSRLLAVRAARPRPRRDEKILADWNGLAVSALARGSRVLGEPRFLAAASLAADFLLSRLRDREGNLLHVWINREAKVDGFLADHAFLLAALVDLYEASGDGNRLTQAGELARAMIREFWDASGEGFFDTGPRHGDLIARTRHAEDNSIPSGNGMAAWALLRLARITGDAELGDYGARTMRAHTPTMAAIPTATCQMLLALDFHLAPPQEIALAGPSDADETLALRGVVDRLFLPHAVLLHANGREPADLAGLEGKTTVGGRAAAYVCSNFSCMAPVTTPGDLEAALKR